MQINGTANTSHTMERDPKFYCELKQANEDLLSYLQENQKICAYFDYTNTFRSYTKLIEDLKQQYPPGQQNSLPWTQQSSTFENKPLFSLSHNQQQNSTLDETNKTINVTSASDQTVVAAGQNGADDDEQPLEPNLDKYEETGAKFQCRAKLFEKNIADDSKSLTYVGCGELYVKDLECPSKLHLIMRQDPDLRKVLLNQTITKNIPMAQKTRTVLITGLEVNGVRKTYGIKVKEEKIASELYNLLNSPRTQPAE